MQWGEGSLGLVFALGGFAVCFSSLQSAGERQGGVLNFIFGVAAMGMFWFLIEFQSLETAFIALAAGTVFQFIAIGNRLDHYGRILDRMNGLPSDLADLDDLDDLDE